MKILRRKARVVRIGSVSIGGNNPIAIQSMVKAKTADIEDTVRQINNLKAAGCQIVRLAIKDNADTKALKAIKRKVKIPIVADIHFDWRLALEAINNGVDKIRLNPGNIYKKEQVKEIARAAQLNCIPIRVGLNSGSLPITNYQLPITKHIADRMVKAALDYIRILEKCNFYDIVVSLKASSIFDTIEAYRKMANSCDYPFHLGVTATGLPFTGAIKSAIAIGALLLEGLGDTIRVSLTDKPEEEIKAARSILEALGLSHFSPEIISCPTCGRCEVDLIKMVKNLEAKLSAIRYPCLSGRQALSAIPPKVAIMGCVVNGPGEAKQADIGIAFGKNRGLLFKKGKPLRKVSSEKCVDVLLEEIYKIKK